MEKGNSLSTHRPTEFYGIDWNQYNEMYRHSLNDPDGFWAEQAQRLVWMKPFTKVKNTSFDPENLYIKWFEDGTLNVSANCLDRHLATRGHQIAFLWEGDSPDETRKVTYNQLYQDVCRFANSLKSLGVKKGDPVIIYLPMIPEVAVAMLACARIGAVHSVVFGGYSPQSLASRVQDCKAKLIITSDEGFRRGKVLTFKKSVDEAISQHNLTFVKDVVVVKRTGGNIPWDSNRDHWYHQLLTHASLHCPPTEMNAEDPLFILYTSGSTGVPKGVLHTTGGYLVYASMTHQYVFNYKDGDVYWCTADAGWITGHSYGIYGPLCNGATSVMFEGTPDYPNFSRLWQLVDRYQVNIFYTAPTVIRSLMREGESPIRKYKLASLRVLGSVGEPIDPTTWEWYYRVIGKKKCPISDTWWQTETGGIMITPLPGAITLKPGSATLPFFGITPALVDNQGKILNGDTEGNLVICDSWPGQMRTLFGNHERFLSYFTTFPGAFYTGDGARRDQDGYYWITGRIDDVLNISGHRIGTAEVEGALESHPKVAEAAVVGIPHETKGQGIYAYIVLKSGHKPSETLYKELNAWLRKIIGPIVSLDSVQWAQNLPKTRSGKVMRRILRKIASNDFETLGDVSTLAEPVVVDELIKAHQSSSAYASCSA